MGRLYTSSPRLAGCTTPKIIHSFEVGVSRDGDAWPCIRYSTGIVEEYRECGGRFRSPMIGGGGSDAVYFSLKKLHQLLRQEELTLADGAQGDLFGARPRHLACPKRERHMDDGAGFLAVEVNRSGHIVVSMRPLDNTRYSRDKPISITIPPSTPYQRSYAGLLDLWRALGADNRKLGNFAGHHTF